MEIKINKISATKKEITVVLPLPEIEKHIQKATETISFEKTIKGFRPGKAPKKIIEEKFGKEIIWQEACNLAIKESYFKVMEENSFSVVAPPEIKIESIEINKPLEYKIIIEIFPEITLPDYKKIAEEESKNEKEVSVEEKEVDEALASIQESRAKIKTVSRSARIGDEVSIDFQGLIDGVEQKNLKAEKLDIILGKKRMIEGFEEELVGLKEGDSKTFFLETDLSGNDKKKVEFRVKINSVKEREIPELNDEFAKSLGMFSDLKDLREKIKENIKNEKENREKERIKAKIVEAIANKSSIDIPESMIEKEIENMVTEFKEKILQSNLTFEEYLKQAKKSENDFKEELRISARKRISMGLVLQEIAKKEKIEVGDKEVNDYLDKFYNKGAGFPDIQKLKEHVANIILNEKIFNSLIKKP